MLASVAARLALKTSRTSCCTLLLFPGISDCLIHTGSIDDCLQSPAFTSSFISLSLSLLLFLPYLDMVCSAATCKHLHFCFQVLFIYGSYLLSNTHTHTRASTPRRGQTVNQTFRHPDSGSAAMSIIGQERERREASGRRVPHGQKGGEAHRLPPERFVAREHQRV